MRVQIGFWAVVSLVIGSQIGSGIFMLPSSLARFGGLGTVSWLIAGMGAIFLALVFSMLCKKVPKTGGPHAYVQKAFGTSFSFFTAWTYWVISWVSSIAVVISAVGYISSLVGGLSWMQSFTLEMIIIFSFMAINLYGLEASGKTELIFTVLKVVPLLMLPIACIPVFNASHFTPLNPSDMPTLSALNAALLLTFWGFIGVECATTPAGSVKDPQKTIPRAIILGTITVAFIYFVSSTAIMGVIEPSALQKSEAPFADVAKILFGGNWDKIFAGIAVIVCLGTLNAWVLTSGQIALGAAKDHLFPKIFLKQNRFEAPVFAIAISCFGIIPFLFLSMSDTLGGQLEIIIDVSVTAFLFVYIICIISYIKILKEDGELTLSRLFLGLGAIIFCLWAMAGAELYMLGLSFLIILSGVPVYFYQKKHF
jgi:APA family basic amino acid/polyamine antiporter